MCGSDNHTYLNACELKLHACQTQQHVQLLYTGQCRNKISSTELTSSDNGRNLQNGLATTVVASIKSADFSKNNAANAESRRRSPTDWCSGVQCHYGAQCVIQDQTVVSLSDSLNPESLSNGSQRVVCQCPALCSAYNVQMSQLIHSLEPSLESINNDIFQADVRGTLQSVICAFDGKQYSNVCALLRKSCLEQRTISIKYVGACGKCFYSFIKVMKNSIFLLTMLFFGRPMYEP